MVRRPGQPGSRAAVVVIAAADAVLERVPSAPQLLAGYERDRLSRFTSRIDQQSYLAAHILVRLCASYVVGSPPAAEIAQRCDACGGRHGRPTMPTAPGLQLSLAHARGVVAAAAGPEPVGVDVESVDPASRFLEVEEQIASVRERNALSSGADRARRLAMLWVRKEAVVKAGLATVDTMAATDLGGLPSELPAGTERWSVWRGVTVVDVIRHQPASVGCAVSHAEITLVELGELWAPTPTGRATPPSWDCLAP